MKKKILLSMILSSALFLGACSQVDNGERGLYVKWGETQDEVLKEGVYFYNLFSTSLITIDTKEKLWSEKTFAYTSDVQQVDISFTLTYYPKRDKINVIYKEYGSDFLNKILPPPTYSIIKEISGKYTAVEMVTKRDEISSKIYENLKKELNNKDIELSRFNITNLDFKDEFEKSVEDKVIASQLAEKAKNDTIRIQEEANQKLIQAKAEAEAMGIKSEALSKNKSLVEYEAVQKWNGQLPQYVGTGMPFLNLSPKN